ncbi:MAG: ABC transporter permease [Chloroflexi bacterium]|nr:ABC transporter permease [Chloroflexota bacterium]
MLDPLVIATLQSVVASASPLIFAGIGETLTERVGIVNLSLDGTILLSAMAGFAAAYLGNSLLLGFFVAAVVGALVALVVALSSIVLKQDQVAIGFVLTLLCADLSSFIGLPYVRIPGPSVPYMPLGVLASIPVLGEVFFRQNLVVYASYVTVFLAWGWLSLTRPGLRLRSVGERPEAAFARGIAVNRLRYTYAAIGGALVGIAGASYSLSVKLGWSHRHTSGMGWIALAIVIFGGWSPFRVALGAYLFGALKSLGSILQPSYPNVPTQVFQAAPFALMVVALLVVGGGAAWVERYVPAKLQRGILALIGGSPPAALGKRFEQL